MENFQLITGSTTATQRRFEANLLVPRGKIYGLHRLAFWFLPPGPGLDEFMKIMENTSVGLDTEGVSGRITRLTGRALHSPFQIGTPYQTWVPEGLRIWLWMEFHEPARALAGLTLTLDYEVESRRLLTREAQP